MRAPRHLSAHLALLGANLFYGAGFTVAKTVMPGLIRPFGFILIRVVTVTLLFWVTWLGGAAWRVRIERRDWLRLVLGGLFGVALNQLLFFYGLNLTEPIHASLIMLVTPLLITAISTVVLRDRLGADKALGLLLGVGGAALLIVGRRAGGTTAAPDILRGDLSVLANAASYAVYLVMIRPLMGRYRPIVVIRWVFFFGTLMVLPFGWRQFAGVDWALFSAWNYAAVAFIVVCCTFCTYLWNTYALRFLPPSTAGAYIYLQPFFAAIIAVVWAGEALTAPKVGAALLIFTGVYLVNFGWRRSAAAA